MELHTMLCFWLALAYMVDAGSIGSYGSYSGNPIAFTLTGFKASESFTLVFTPAYGCSPPSASGTTNSGGYQLIQYTIPSNCSIGTYTMTVTGVSGSKAIGSLTLSPHPGSITPEQIPAYTGQDLIVDFSGGAPYQGYSYYLEGPDGFPVNFLDQDDFNGVTDDGGETQFTFSIPFSAPVSAKYTISVSLADGSESQVLLAITITNPVITISPLIHLKIGDTIQVTVQGAASSKTGSPVTYSLISPAPGNMVATNGTQTAINGTTAVFPVTIPAGAGYSAGSWTLRATYYDPDGNALSTDETIDVAVSPLTVKVVDLRATYSAGQTFTFNVTNGVGGESVSVALYNVDQGQEGSTFFDLQSNGGLSRATFTIPSNIPVGDYQFQVTRLQDSTTYSDTASVIHIAAPLASVSNTVAYSGTQATFAISAFPASQAFSYTFSTASLQGGSSTTSASGVGTFSVAVPNTLAVGAYTVTVTSSPSTTATGTLTISSRTVGIQPSANIGYTGQGFSFVLSGAAANQAFTYGVTGPSVLIPSTTSSNANDSGGATVPFDIPFGTNPGTYTITVTLADTSSGTASFQISNSNPIITITPSSGVTLGTSIQLTVQGALSQSPVTYTLQTPTGVTIASGSPNSDSSGQLGPIPIPLSKSSGYPSGDYNVTASYQSAGGNTLKTSRLFHVSVSGLQVDVLDVQSSYNWGDQFHFNVLYGIGSELIAANLHQSVYSSPTSVDPTMSYTLSATGTLSDAAFTIPSNIPPGAYKLSISRSAEPSYSDETDVFNVKAVIPTVDITSSSPAKAGSTIVFDIANLVNGFVVSYNLYDLENNAILSTAPTSDPQSGAVSGATIDIPATLGSGTYYVQAVQSQFANPSAARDGAIVIQALPSAGGGQRRRRLRRRKLQNVCPIDGETACYTKSGNYECIDLTSDLENCGGCTTDGTNGLIVGQNCLEIPHAIGVACRNAKCHITSCNGRFWPTADGSKCR